MKEQYKKMQSFINRVRLFTDYVLKKYKVSSFPEEYVIEVSKACNLKCVMCPLFQKDVEQGIMERSVFETIVHKIKDHAGFVFLIGRGEPLLHPDFIEYVKLCKMQGLKVGTSTNCTRLTKDMSKQIIESGLDHIIFPLEGTNKEEYEKIRVGANFENTVENINMFLTLKKQLNSKIYISVQGLTFDKKINNYKSYRKSVIKLFPDNNKYIDEIRLKPLIEYGKEEHQHSKPCMLLWRNVFINFKGDVLSCCQDSYEVYVLGNLLQEDFRDIWNSDKMQYLRKMNFAPKTMNELETRKHCDLRDEYSGILPLLGSTIAGPSLSRKFIAMYENYFMK
jgi:radical SAM protein with 4Fe4S-binding SPASM domain